MNATTTPDWTHMFSCSVTHTTKYGYSNTCTLAAAVRNTQWSNLWNLGHAFARLGMAIGMVAEQSAAKAVKAAKTKRAR